MTDKNRLIVFYAWQSDLPSKSNRQAIKSAIMPALSRIEESRDDVTLVFDEATRNLPGSPNIPIAILSKIEQADVFICDVTSINENSSYRKVPNPNVVFELGYAVAHLGWSRVILMYNDAIGSFDSDLPFDFDRHRAARYTADAPPTKRQEEELRALVLSAIDAIISNNPSRPSADLSPEEVMHARDVSNLHWLLSKLHIPTLDFHALWCPFQMHDAALDFWRDFNEVYTSSMFYLHDIELRNLLREFHSAYEQTVSYGEHYEELGSSSVYRFMQPETITTDSKKADIWININNAANTMREKLPQMLNYIRENYLEIDIDHTSKLAWDSRIEHLRKQEVLKES